MLFNTFNFSRIHFLKPLIWYMLFALALFLIWKTLRISHLIIIALIISQSYLLIVETEEMKYSKFNTPTFKEFYATELFSDIKNYIGRNQKDSGLSVPLCIRPSLNTMVFIHWTHITIQFQLNINIISEKLLLQN